MSSNQTEEEKDRQVEAELQMALTIANRLYKVVSNPEFLKEVPDARDRHEIVNMQLSKMDTQMGSQMYTQFSSAYPMVLKYITQQVSFNAKAFEMFFRKQVADPGKGMEGFIDHQSNYARLLYIEASKAAGKHYSIKKANKLKQREFQQMDKIRKDIEKSRKDAENSFEKESVQHLDERKQELLNFINQELDENDIPMDEYSEESDSDESSEEETPKEQMMTDEEWWEQATDNERMGKIKTLKFLEGVLVNEIEERDELVEKLTKQKEEKDEKEKEEKAIRAKEIQESWLQGTITYKKKSKKSKKKNNRKKKR
jgi:hypothetical protein